MEFLIDKKFWNKVVKKLPATYALWLKNNLKQTHFEEEKYFVEKKDNSELWGYRTETKYRKKNMGWKLRRDFVLNISNKEIYQGFLYKQCFAFPPDIKENHIPIEKIILEILIQEYGLSESVLYEGEYIIEQGQNIEFIEKGFVYLIRNDDIYKIGITDNLLRRFNQLKPDEILNVVRCSNYENLEKDLHKKFKKNRIPQTEYFRLNQNQIEEVNIAMTKGADF